MLFALKTQVEYFKLQSGEEVKQRCLEYQSTWQSFDFKREAATTSADRDVTSKRGEAK